MFDQQPGPDPVQMPTARGAYASPQVPGVSTGYRRWAKVFVWSAIILGVLMVVAFVLSIVLLVLADADVNNAAYGYLAIVLWAVIVVVMPILIGVAIAGAVMTRHVRRQRQAGTIPA
ncbi:hypothetical protein [Kribbella deserti]|uniref:Uncharacterized protein n=1 Tax=Kribbella deserti TaxID=1926257 RepID=A0ABV6QR40_9ACTN